MRYAVIAALVAGAAAVPFNHRGPGRFGRPMQEVDTDCEVAYVTVDGPGSTTDVPASTSDVVPSPSPSSSDVQVDPVTLSTTSTTRRRPHHPHHGHPTQKPGTTTALPTTIQTSTSKPASPPSSQSSTVVPSTTAEATTSTTSAQSEATTPAGSTPFPYPSGVINVDGWDYTLSAPTQFTWTGDLNPAEHATTYTMTQDDGSVRTTSTTEGTCATAAPDYVKAALDGHNTKRAAHSANPVVWDDNLACIAQRQAESCIWDHLTYVNGGGYGQNLAGGTEVADSVEMWYGEAGEFSSYYGEQSPPFVAGHFTQVVWASTTSIGCATYDCGSGTGEENSATGALTVCNYWVGGNMGGFYGVNVLPPMDS